MTKSVDITIEPFTNADLSTIVAINQACDAFPWRLSHFEQSINAHHHCVCIKFQHNTVGFAVAKINRFEAELLQIGILPAYQKKGLASLLLKSIIAVSQSQSQQFFLEVRESNKAAIALYESFDFNCVGQRDNYYPAPKGREDALIYALELHI